MAQEIEDLQAVVREEVRREGARVAALVAQREDEPEFYRLEEAAAAVPEDSKEKARLLRRLRRLEPPTRGQVLRRRVAGIGLVAALTGFAWVQGMETQNAMQLSQEALYNLGPNLGTAISHVQVDIFNLGKTFNEASQAVNGVVTSTVNTANNVIDHAVRTGEVIGADILALIARPWRRPRKRGRVPL